MVTGMNLFRSLGLSAVALTVALAAVPAAQAQERPLETLLAGVEDTTCEPLDGDVEYGCRMLYWGFYVFEHQTLCHQLEPYVPWYIFGERVMCTPPDEPPRGGLGELL